MKNRILRTIYRLLLKENQRVVKYQDGNLQISADNDKYSNISPYRLYLDDKVHQHFYMDQCDAYATLTEKHYYIQNGRAKEVP